MAQVRKFQSGGKTFKINGKTYNTSNSEDMKRLEEMTSNSEYGGIAQQILANVNDAAYDNTLNVYRTSDGRVMMEGSLQDVTDQYMSQGTQKATQRKDNIINNTFKRRSGKEWINNLDSFLNAFDSKSSANSSTSNTDGKIKISGVSGLGGQWKYNDQGWDEADINNAAMLKEWQLLEDYYNDSLTLSKEDLDKKYDISGLDKRSLEAYMNMRKTTPDLYSRYVNSFKPNAAVLDNDDFYSTYGWFGFTPGTSEEIAANKAAANNKALKEYLTSQGLDFDGAENVFYRDKDGNLMVTDAFLTNVLGGDRTGHYWLNDNWANLRDEQGNTNPYSQMRNHIIWNGRVYKQDDAAVLAELQKSGYIDANKAYDAARAEQIMRTQWSNNPTFAHEAYDPETRYSEWAHGYKDKGLRYRTLESNLGEGKSLVGYYTNDDPADNYGFRTERFAIIGDDGKLIQDNVDPSTIAKTENGQYVSGTTSFMQKRLGKDAGILAGTYIDGTSIDGKPSNTFFYPNPDTGEYFIQDPDLKGVQKGNAVRIPKEIAAIVPEEAWEYFRTHKDAKDRLFGYLKNFTNTGWGKFWNQGDGLFGTRNIILRSDFRKAGLSEEQAAQVVKLLNEWGTNRKYREATGKYDSSSIDRQQAFIADPQTGEIVQPVFKEGGKIEKHQYGNVLGQQGKTELKTVNLKEGNVKDANTNQSFGLGSRDSKQWSSLDTMELAGAAADLAALGITIADPTNIGGAIAGAAGSLTNFGVDVKRDGFQGKDLGRLALNLVLDAGTLIPILGDGLQGAKAVRAMKKAAPVLAKAIKTGAIVGVGDAVYNTIDKIAKGESFTISDVRRIINGISGGVTLGRTGLLNQTKHRVDVDPGLTIKGKPNSGVADIKLSKEQIKEITDAPKAEQMKKLTEVLKKAGHDVDKLDLDSVAKTIKSPQWKFWKGWDKTVVPDISKGGSKRVDLTSEDLAKLQRERNGFQNWFFGTGKAQRAYNNFLMTGQTPSFEHDVRLGRWYRGIDTSIDGSTATRGGWYRHTPKWIAPEHLTHASPFGKRFFLRPVLPNIVSTQQFPQEMEFTENVSTMPMKRLVFKKGGVLKGQSGIPSLILDLTKNIDTSKFGKPSLTITENGLEGGTDVAGIASRYAIPTVPEYKPSGPQTISTNYAVDHKGYNGSMSETPTLTDTPAKTTGWMGGRVLKGKHNNIDWNYIARESADAGNMLRAINDARKFKNISDRKANAIASLAPDIWQDKGRARFQTITPNLVNSQIAKNNTFAGTINTADSGLNLAGRLRIADMNNEALGDANRTIAEEYNNHLQQDSARRMQSDQLTFQTKNARNQFMIAPVTSKFAGETELFTNLGSVADKAAVKWQNYLNNKGLTSVVAQNKIDQLKLMKAQPGLSKEQVKAIDDQIATINSAEYQNILARQGRYGSIPSAKKGTKLRSTTEQMLLDNNRLVQKAISKLNEGTMELILKAMS